MIYYVASKLKKQKKKIVQAEVVNFYLAMRAFTYSLIESNPRQNYTISEICQCITSIVMRTLIFRKNDLIYSFGKRTLIREYLSDFRDNWNTRLRIFLIQSSFSLSKSNIRPLRDLWVNFTTSLLNI